MRQATTIPILLASALLQSGPAASVEVDTIAVEPSLSGASALAAEIEAAGQYVRAAEILEPFSGSTPYYPLDLRLGWLWFQAADYERAEQHYTRAAAVSPEAPDPQLGLAWCALRLGRIGEAADRFEALTETAPSLQSAHEGLAIARASSALKYRIGVSAGGHAYTGASFKSWAAGGAVDANLFFSNGGILTATYRFTQLGLAETSVSEASTASHHAAFLSGGWANARFGFTVHYGLLADTSAVDVTFTPATGGSVGGVSVTEDTAFTHIFGTILRASPFGDITLELSGSLSEALNVYRIAPAWRFDLGGGFSIRPGAALQVADGEVFWNASLQLAWANDRGGAWVSGKYGAEVRPAYLESSIAYDVNEQIDFGLALGGHVVVSPGTSVSLAYEMVRYALESDTSAITRQSNAHFFTLGVSFGSATY